MKDMMEDDDVVKSSIQKLRMISSKVGEKYKEDISEIIDALKSYAGVYDDEEGDMEDSEDSPKKSIIIASLKKKFSPSEEYGE